MSDSRVSPETLALIDGALVWDAHAGVFPSPQVDLNLLDEWRAHKVNYVSINVGFDVLSPRETMATLDAYRCWVMDNPGRFALAGTIEEVERAREDGRLAVSFDIEGMNALGGKLESIESFHALGVRQMLFAYNLNNDAAGGCHDQDVGLTSFGRDIVAEMNRVGMIVDCSHASFKTSMEIIELSTSPAVFTHSNPRAVWDHERNISDEQIRACAGAGGVIGLNGMGIFLGDNDVGIDALERHLLHLCDVAGPAHVGLGFDHTPDIKVDVGAILRSRPEYWPQGRQYDTPDIGHAGPPQLPGLVERLRGRGLHDADLRGILGENFRRVAAQAWAPAV